MFEDYGDLQGWREFFEVADKVERLIKLVYSKKGRRLNKEVAGKMAGFLLERKSYDEMLEEFEKTGRKVSKSTVWYYAHPELIEKYRERRRKRYRERKEEKKKKYHPNSQEKRKARLAREIAEMLKEGRELGEIREELEIKWPTLLSVLPEIRRYI